MKVAFLIEQLHPERGGMETSATEFLTEVAGLGVDIHVITQSAPDDFSIVPVHALSSCRLGRAARYWNFVYGAKAFLAQSNWNVVHAVTPCLSCNLYQPRSGVANEALARSVASRRNWIARALRKLGASLDAKQYVWTRFERQLLQNPKPPIVAALSGYMQRQLERAYALPSGFIRNIFNGVTIQLPEPAERAATRHHLRQELGLNSAVLVAIFAGHNFRRKGLPRLLEALARPEAAGWRLLVAGKDKIGPYLRYAKRLGIAEKVRFLGPRSDLRQLYLTADVCVLPTYYDPCSRTVLEALSLGLPSITTAYDGSADCIREGDHGFVLQSPEDVEALAQALQRLAPESIRQRILRNALELRPRLSMRRHAEEIVALYEEITRRESVRPVSHQFT
jgi:UDP-glucose:(heptosyl)LPS alpha-1,3-glucosyltransferase